MGVFKCNPFPFDLNKDKYNKRSIMKEVVLGHEMFTY
jgi:hypothetical protein